MSQQDEFLDVNELAKRLDVSASYLNRARLTGSGPPFHKFGRTVRYAWASALEWVNAQTRRSTSEDGRAA
jgi:hypothetical protein